MKTGILWDELFLKHDTGPAHPESKERLLSIRQGLESYPHLKDLKRLGLRPATETELRLVHPAAYIRNIQRSAGKPFTYLDPDTAVCDASYEVAIHAVGGVLQMIESLMSGEIDNGFAFVRPPGHHAEPDRAMGFCLFSNVALGAAYALNASGCNASWWLTSTSTTGMALKRPFTTAKMSCSSPPISIPFFRARAPSLKPEAPPARGSPSTFPSPPAPEMPPTAGSSRTSSFRLPRPTGPN